MRTEAQILDAITDLKIKIAFDVIFNDGVHEPIYTAILRELESKVKPRGIKKNRIKIA